MVRFLFSIAVLVLFAAMSFAEPAPTPTPMLEPGMDTRAPRPKKLPRPVAPKLPSVPAGATPFDTGNAPIEQ